MNPVYNKENNNLFKIGDNYICVSDEKIKIGDAYIHTDAELLLLGFFFATNESNNSDGNPMKIIFSTKFIHESVPVLYIDSEEDVTEQARKYLIENGFDGHAKHSLTPVWMNTFYQKAKEKYQFTLADIRKMYDMSCGKIGLGELSDQTENNQRFEDLLKSLQQPKEIKSIEVEYEDVFIQGDNEEDEEFNLKRVLRPIIIPNGKVKCKVNY